MRTAAAGRRLLDRLDRLVEDEIEEREEELGLLRARDGVAALEDEARDGVDAEAAGGAVLRLGLVAAAVAGEVEGGLGAIEADLAGELDQRRAVADVAPLREVGAEQRLDRLLAAPRARRSG